MFPSARASPVLALHAFVLGVIAAFIAVLALKQQNPFKKHYATMVAILVDLFIYALIVLLSFKLEGFAEEVATSISILLGLLSSQLLILIMVPILGWFCLVLWVLFIFFVVYKLLSGRNIREPPQQTNPSQNHVGIQQMNPSQNHVGNIQGSFLFVCALVQLPFSRAQSVSAPRHNSSADAVSRVHNQSQMMSRSDAKMTTSHQINTEKRCIELSLSQDDDVIPQQSCEC